MFEIWLSLSISLPTSMNDKSKILLVIALYASGQTVHYSSRWGKGVGGRWIISFSLFLFCPPNLYLFLPWICSFPVCLPSRQPHHTTSPDMAWRKSSRIECVHIRQMLVKIKQHFLYQKNPLENKTNLD